MSDAAIPDLPYEDGEEFWMVSTTTPHHLDKNPTYSFEFVRVRFRATRLVFQGHRPSDSTLVECEARHAAKTKKQAVLKSFTNWKDVPNEKTREAILDLLKAWWKEHKNDD